MSRCGKGIILAVVQLAIVVSLGAKYAIDRGRFPRVWAQTAAYDPDLPIRGRYLSVRVRVDADRVYAGSELPKGNVANFCSHQRDVTLGSDGAHLLPYPPPTPTRVRSTQC